MLSFLPKLLSSFVLVFALAQGAQASLHFDIYGGGASPSTDDTSLRATYMLSAGYKLDFGLSLGAVYSFSSKDEDLGRFEYILKGIEASYYFDKWIKGLYLSFRTGLVDVETELGGEEFKSNPFAWGWYFGQDFELNSYFTAGYDLGFLSVNGDEGIVNGTTQTLENFVSYSLMASLKLWF